MHLRGKLIIYLIDEELSIMFVHVKPVMLSTSLVDWKYNGSLIEQDFKPISNAT